MAQEGHIDIFATVGRNKEPAALILGDLDGIARDSYAIVGNVVTTILVDLVQ